MNRKKNPDVASVFTGIAVGVVGVWALYYFLSPKRTSGIAQASPGYVDTSGNPSPPGGRPPGAYPGAVVIPNDMPSVDIYGNPTGY